jgi:hypothetical protein
MVDKDTGVWLSQEEDEDGLDYSDLQTFQLQLVRRITKDALEKAGASPTNMSKDEIRFMVASYYGVQELRKLLNNRVSALSKRDDPATMFDFIFSGVDITEKNIKKFLAVASATHPIGRWAESIRGIGPVISAGFLAHIDITKAPTVGHIWRFAGMDPTLDWLGKEKATTLVNSVLPRGATLTDEQFVEIANLANRRADALMTQVQNFAESTKKGTYLTKENVIKTLSKRPYNADLKLICWKAGESFVKTSNHPQDIYGHVYAARKVLEIQQNEAGAYKEQADAKASKVGRSTDAYKSYSIGQLPPAHIHARAKRYAVKLFLAHWHHVAFEIEYGTPPPKPYILNQEGHTHYIAPPNWPMENGVYVPKKSGSKTVK